jgi:hypothetical protein
MKCDPTSSNASSFAINVSRWLGLVSINVSQKWSGMRARVFSNASRYSYWLPAYRYDAMFILN